MTACGAASIYIRPGLGYPKVKPLQSVKKWQRTFFYLRNPDPERDGLNLPEFELAPPAARLN